MKDGFIKVAAGTPEVRVCDTAFNAAATIEMMKQAAKQGVKLLVMPEMGLTAYTCSDLLFDDTLLQAAKEALQKVTEQTADLDLVTAVGLPLDVNHVLYNSAAIINHGKILGIVPKAYLPNYGEFYEKRQFVAAEPEAQVISLNGQNEIPFGKELLFYCSSLPLLKIGFEICEDIWVPSSPSLNMCANGALIIGNLSASNEVIGKAEYRRNMVAAHSGKLGCGYIYTSAGAGESTTDVVFSGHDIIAENGSVVAEQRFKTGLLVTEIDICHIDEERRRLQTYAHQAHTAIQIPFELTIEDTVMTRPLSCSPFVPHDLSVRKARCEEILQITALGLETRLRHVGCKTCVIGLSGGLDSTLAALITAEALKRMNRPASDLIAVTMPCFGTTDRTKNNAVVLAEALGATLRTIDISVAVKQHLNDIDHDINDHSVTYENAQARMRTMVLMDIANQTNGLVIGTGDLSELALGWCTYNGDHMSMYAVNASIPKTLVRYIIDYLAEKDGQTAQLSTVLKDISATPISPELLPADNGQIVQKTEDLIGPYALHDFFLYHMLRWHSHPTKIYRQARYAFNGQYDDATILKWLNNFYRRFFSQQFKRSCLPDGPKVGTVVLSPRGDWRMPSDACRTAWQAELDQLNAKAK